jgi:hypothetical protein
MCEAGICRLDPDRLCVGVTPGTIRSRTRFAAASVYYGQECQAETQTSFCREERWSAWDGTFAFDLCVVLPRVDCGATSDGGFEIRRCYDAASVPSGSVCTYTEQIRQCRYGSFNPDWPPCDFTSCSVEGHPSCDGQPHGTVEHRTRYASETAPCLAEDQTRICSDGSWSSWTGSYAYDACGPTWPWTAGLVSWWMLDESSGTATDSVGTSHGTVSGAVQNKVGKSNAACSFAGGVDERITLPEVASLEMHDRSFTFAAWIYPTAYDNHDAGWCSIIGGETGAASFGLQTDGSLRLTQINVGDAPDSSLVPPLDRWSFVAVTVDRTAAASNLTYFVDGRAQAATYAEDFAAGAASHLLGARTTSARSFIGIVDEVMIWNRALSATELYLLYRWLEAAPRGGLAGHWPLDEPSSATAASDLSGNGNDGVLTHGPVWGEASGRVGGALALDGIDDVVIVPDDGTLDMSAELTVSTWVYLAAPPTHRMGLVDKGYIDEYYLQIRDDPQVIHTYTHNGDEGIIVSQSWDDWLGRWMHVAWTLNGVRVS